MRRFAELYAELDQTTATGRKVEALRRYFAGAPDADAAWAVYFLAGGRPRQLVPTAVLRSLACARAGIDDWLFEECYQAVGDLAETIALVLPRSGMDSALGLAAWVEDRLLPLRDLPADVQADRIAGYWDELDTAGRFLLTKLIGGGFRVGVSRLLVQRALALHAGIEPQRVAQRMMGYTDAKAMPGGARYRALLARDAAPVTDLGQPYPFFLAHAVDGGSDLAASLGPVAQWIVEWKYDGIRAQVVKRGGRVWVWSRGEELVTERFPEVVSQAQALPDGCVLDGEIVAWQDGAPAPFALLQQRIGRKTLTARVLAGAPARFIAFDILEWAGADVRAQPQRERRELLERALAGGAWLVSPRVQGQDWAALAALRRTAREQGVEGLMLKHRDAAYGTGRTKAGGTWWKWKVEPMTVDGVLVYAQRGHGRRSSVYTDYTFAVWSRQPVDADEAAEAVDAVARREGQGDARDVHALRLVPFAKAYAGLTDAEFAEVDRIVRATTLEKFGPVRSVRPTLVFELGFEGIQRSGRHRSGIAVRFPRMLRIRRDKPLHEADTLATLEALIAS
jgi:DNA ligase-1